jgi:hephaestin
MHCRVADHVASGMRAKYEVLYDAAVLAATRRTNVTRRYFIQAEPIYWDYAPGGYK